MSNSAKSKDMEILWKEGDITAAKIDELSKNIDWGKNTTYITNKKCNDKNVNIINAERIKYMRKNVRVFLGIVLTVFLSL